MTVGALTYTDVRNDMFVAAWSMTVETLIHTVAAWSMTVGALTYTVAAWGMTVGAWSKAVGAFTNEK